MDRYRRNIAPIAGHCNLESLVRMSGQRTIFPFYHTVSKWHLPHVRHLYRYRKISEFESDLDEMMKRFVPVSLSDYLKDPGRKHGERRMILSFDDGLEECHQFIAPVLKRKGIPAVFFLNNQFIDNRGLFYRYKASLLIDHIKNECKAREKAVEFLVIPEDQLEPALKLVGYRQQALLDGLARELDYDFTGYLKETPVYLDSKQVLDLVEWGFELGGHSPDHADFSLMEGKEVINQVKESLLDLRQRFRVSTRYFSFPFTSSGVSKETIQTLLDDGIAHAILGTAGLKRTWDPRFIQRIPMEDFQMPAGPALKTEFLYYLLKMPTGRNRIRS